METFKKLRSTGQADGLLANIMHQLQNIDKDVFEQLRSKYLYSVRDRGYQVKTLGEQVDEYLNPPYDMKVLNDYVEAEGYTHLAELTKVNPDAI